MRPLILPVLLVALLQSNRSTAQLSTGLGLKGGPQLTTWRSAARTYGPMVGMSVGAYVPVGLGNRLEVQPELLVSYQGATWEVPEGKGRNLRELKVVLPLSAKYFLGRTFNLQAGAFGAYGLLAEVNGEDVLDGMQTTEMGLLVGMGIDGQTGLDLSVRYSSGITALLNDDILLYPTSRALQLACGYRIAQFSTNRQRRH